MDPSTAIPNDPHLTAGMLVVYYCVGVSIFRFIDLKVADSHKLVALPILGLCIATDVLAYYYPKDR